MAEVCGGKSGSSATKGTTCLRVDVPAEVNRTTPHLASYERIKKVVLRGRDFDVDSELTPSLKVKRHIVEKTFKSLIDFLYKE